MQEYISQQDRKAHANARGVVSRKASKTALVDQRPQQELMQRKAAIQRNRTGLPDL